MRSFRVAGIFVFTALLIVFPRDARSQPATPAGFVADPPTACGAIRLSWTPVPGVTGYHLYRDGTRLTSLRQSADRYYDYEMPGPGLYTYSIESYDETGVSLPATDDSTLPAPTLTVDPWDWFHDVFPTTAIAPGAPGFEASTAKVRTGRNLAALVGIVGRAVEPASNVTISAPGALGVTIVYRIKPGPGNYAVPGLPGAGLLWDPALGVGGGIACPGDASYWGPDIDPPACPGIGTWDINKWITRDCDVLIGDDYVTTTGGDPVFPDDLFTPGTVIQYYFEASYAGGVTARLPDPDCVMQVANQNNLDGHRWEQFTVLPDLWKDPAYGGLGLACVLVVDLEDGRGNERTWAGLADSLGATSPAARGRYNGWTAPGGVDPVDLDSPAHFVAGPTMAAGTTWDLYSVRGGESNDFGNAGALGGRLGVVPVGFFPPGPTPAMLAEYYRIVVLLTGNRSSDILGPIIDRSQDDEAMLTGFLLGGADGDHRGILVVGNGFATSEAAAHPAFLGGPLATLLTAASYPALSGNTNRCSAVVPTSVITTNGNLYGVVNPAGAANDVLDPAAGGFAAGFYDDPADGFIASVFKDAVFPDFWQALTEGWNIRDMTAPLCASGYGRLVHYFDVFQNVFAKICPVLVSPLVTIDVPDAGPSRAGTPVLALRNNPVREGSVEVRFALEEADRVRAAISDVSGRILRVIHAREYPAGDHVLTWDGRDEAGHPSPRGVYYMRVSFERAGASGARKIVLLK